MFIKKAGFLPCLFYFLKSSGKELIIILTMWVDFQIIKVIFLLKGEA